MNSADCVKSEMDLLCADFTKNSNLLTIMRCLSVRLDDVTGESDPIQIFFRRVITRPSFHHLIERVVSGMDLSGEVLPPPVSFILVR